MRLYVDSQYTSPYAMSAFVALKEKQLPFDMIAVDLAVGDNKRPEYATTSLTQRVPTLVDGELMLSESSAIAEYLHEAYAGQPLYPASIADRARARQLQAWLRSDLMPIRQERSAECLYQRRAHEPLSTAAHAAANKLFFVTNSLLSVERKNLFGDWCIADTDLALMLNRLIMSGEKVPDRFVSYAAHQWQRPSVQQWLGQPRSLV